MYADIVFSTEPHIGHLHSLVLADVLKRYRHLRYGEHEPKPVLLTGTDEHGMKIQKAAQGQSVTPVELCDRVSQRFEALAQAANVNYDVFYRTTNPQHVKVVQDVWVGVRFSMRPFLTRLPDNHTSSAGFRTRASSTKPVTKVGIRFQMKHTTRTAKYGTSKGPMVQSR